MSKPQVNKVRQVLKNLRKVTTTFRLYGKDHPNTEHIADSFVGALVPLLEELGRLELNVQSDHLAMGDKVVYRDEEAGSFAELLYREGIQQLTILPGVDRDELLELVRLLSINLNLPGYEEETLISLLWQADFKAILYEAVQGLVEAVEQSEAAAAGEMGAFSEVLSHILATQDDVSALASMDEETLSGMSETSQRAAAAHSLKVNRSGEDHARPATPFTKALQEAAAVAGVSKPVAWSKQQQSAVVETIEWAEGYRGELTVPAEQVAEYWKTLGADTFDSMLGNALEASLFLAAKPVNGLSREHALDLSRRGIEAALDSNSTDPYTTAVGILDRMTGAEEFEDAHAELTKLRDECLTPEALRRVCRAARTAGDRTAGLWAFISSGGVERMLAVRDLLSEIEDEIQASVVMDALNGAAEDNPEILVENIHDLTFEQLIPVYTCVARGEHPKFRKALRHGLRHPRAEVRLHALTMVLGQPDETNAEAVAPLLQDKDPRVRLHALRAFQGIALPDIVPFLHAELEASDFRQKDREEMKLVAKAYGYSHKKEALDVLQSLLKRGRLSQLGQERPDLEALMWGMLATGSDEGRLAVIRATKSFFPSVSRAADKVIAQSKIRTDDGGGSGEDAS
jgi:hypothetical protein